MRSKLGFTLLSVLLLACGGEQTVGPGTRVEMKTDHGVTAAPCPGGHPERGCIYLGTLLDHSGPFAVAGTTYLKSIRAFWGDVNAHGGVGGEYDVAIPDRLARDTRYNPASHTAAYTQIADDVLAIAGSLGTPTTMDTLPRLVEDRTLAVPVSYWSGWSFPEVDHGFALEYQPSYCLEGMDAMDWVAGEEEGRKAARSVGIVYFPSDFGRDYKNGVKVAAAANGVEVRWEQTIVPIAAGGDPAQVEAVNRVVNEPVDAVFLVAGPSELAAVVGGGMQRGYEGVFITANPGLDAGLLHTAAAPAFLSGRVFGSGPFPPWGSDTPGHARAQAALMAAGIEPHDYALSGWISQYRLRAALETAAASGDLTREGLYQASQGLGAIDYEGIMPASDWGSPATVPRHAVISRFDEAGPTGLTLVRDVFVGPTAAGYAYDRPCTEMD